MTKYSNNDGKTTPLSWSLYCQNCYTVVKTLLYINSTCSVEWWFSWRMSSLCARPCKADLATAARYWNEVQWRIACHTISLSFAYKIKSHYIDDMRTCLWRYSEYSLTLFVIVQCLAFTFVDNSLSGFCCDSNTQYHNTYSLASHCCWH